MTADPAARWRAGRDGYSNKRTIELVGPGPRPQDKALADLLKAPLPRGTVSNTNKPRPRHGRAGALYCGTGDTHDYPPFEGTHGVRGAS